MQTILEKIKSRGYWRIVIRPSKFIQNRVSELSHCKEFVRDNSVRLRGWDYPHYDIKNQPISGLDNVEQCSEHKFHKDVWRLYQSGQFVHYRALWEDWKEDPGKEGHIQPNEFLSIFGTMYLLTEIYEFASRLGSKGILGESCEIQISLLNTSNRKLQTFDPARSLFAIYKTSLKEIPHSVPLKTADLMARSAELSLEHVVWLYQRFNWDIDVGAFKEDQRKLLEKRFTV